MNWKEEIENNPYRFLSGTSLDGDEFSLNKEEIKSFIQSTLREELESIKSEVERFKANAQEHTKEDCARLYQGCTECSEATALRRLIINLQERIKELK